MKLGIFIDDIRSPPEMEGVVWLVVSGNFHEFLTHQFPLLVKSGAISVISFDHDLGEMHDGKEFTGYDFLLKVEELAANGEIPNKIELIVHTANVSARKRMEQAVSSIYRLLERR